MVGDAGIELMAIVACHPVKTRRFGMGLSSSASIVLIQEIVDWSERGSVTASYLFARTLGSTFGATSGPSSIWV